MKFTLLGGVKDKAKTFIKKTREYLTRERMIALSMLSRAIGMVLILSVIPIGAMKVTADNDKPIVAQSNTPVSSKIVLDVQKIVPLKLVENKPVIKLAESEDQKKQREAKEAQDKATELALSDASRSVYAREEYRPAPPADADLATKRQLAKDAAAAYGIDWKILEAVWQVESGKSWDTSVNSYAGAQGPMQFMPGTWSAYAVDADGDGNANINNAKDAVYTGAKYLAAGGAASGNVDGALFNYNHAQWYVDMVKDVANSITD